MQYPTPYVPGTYDTDWTSYSAASSMGEGLHPLDGGPSDLGLGTPSAFFAVSDGQFYAEEGQTQATYGGEPHSDLWFF
ncbi:hypothetical protein MD484_g2471, partial [Candolleomyces efflorescens]